MATFRFLSRTPGSIAELLAPMLETFEIRPDFDLGVMEHAQDPVEVLTRILLELRPVLEQLQPELLVVQGDTTTTLAAALCALHQKIPVAHVEAGLRSHSVLAPFPEESNRRLTSHLSAYHFAPTETAKRNLLGENIAEARIAVTGNTAVDALQWAIARIESSPMDFEALVPGLDWNAQRVILVTGHRRESFGAGFEEICAGLDRLAQRNPDVHIVYPVHLNPRVRKVVDARLGGRENIHLIEPVDYLSLFR